MPLIYWHILFYLLKRRKFIIDMGLFDFEDRLDKELEFILLIQKIIEENIRQNRVLVIVTDEYRAENNNSELLGRGLIHLSIFRFTPNP